MRNVFLFPGQGSQYGGMAFDLYQAYPEVRALFDEADGILGFELSECCFAQSGPAERSDWVLRQTDICQPAIFTHSMAALRALGAAPDAVAGHSVGEYSALVASGAITFAEGLRTVRLRAQLMAQANRERPGTMSAVLGLDQAEIEALCTAASRNGQTVQPANFNAPGQIVISGDEAAVQAASSLAMERGARRVLPLRVSGAFHSELMEGVQGRLSLHVADMEIRRPACPVYLNVLGRASRDPEVIRESMLRQLKSPVLWMQSVQAMQADGFSHFVEVGPGRVLSGLVRRILGRKTSVRTLGTRADVERMRTAP